MELQNTSKNKRRSKKKDFNDFSKVTSLIKQYKKSNNENDLLEVIKNLEGIINTYTLILTPGTINQQIYITPYMKKFLGMFLTPEERGVPTIATYNKAIERIRWIMRRFTYEDIYSHVLCILIATIDKMKIIGDCDCIYYIQLITRYKLHDLVMKISLDMEAVITDIPVNHDDPDESMESAIDRLAYIDSCEDNENIIIDSLYENIDFTIVTRKDDIFKVYTYYEKYLIYLNDVLGLTKKQILNILKHETNESLEERFEDIAYKCEIIMKEGD